MDASLPGGRTTASIRHLHGPCTGHCRPRSRSRIMDDESVELPGHHHCLCAQPFFGSAGDSLRTNHWNTSPQRSAGGSGTPHHRAGNASLLPACFRGCSPTFARKVSPVSENVSLLGSLLNRGKGSFLLNTRFPAKIVHITHVAILPLMPLCRWEKRGKGE